MLGKVIIDPARVGMAYIYYGNSTFLSLDMMSMFLHISACMATKLPWYPNQTMSTNKDVLLQSSINDDELLIK